MAFWEVSDRWLREMRNTTGTRPEVKQLMDVFLGGPDRRVQIEAVASWVALARPTQTGEALTDTQSAEFLDERIDAADRGLDQSLKQTFDSLLGTLYPDKESLHLAKTLLVKRLFRGSDYSREEQSCCFPVVFEVTDLGESVRTATPFIMRGRAISGSTGGRIIVSPGLVSGYHSWLTRQVTGQSMFEGIAEVRQSLGIDEAHPNIEIWWEAVNSDRHNVAMNYPLRGDSMTFALYCIARSIYDQTVRSKVLGERFDGAACLLSGAIKNGTVQDISDPREKLAVASNGRFLTTVIQSAACEKVSAENPQAPGKVESLDELWKHVITARQNVEAYLTSLIKACEDIGDISGKTLTDFAAIPIRVGVKTREVEKVEEKRQGSDDAARTQAEADRSRQVDLRDSEQQGVQRIYRTVPEDAFKWAKKKQQGVRQIVSGPGMGKTVATISLASRFARESLESSAKRVPILVPLNELRGLSTEDLISAALVRAKVDHQQHSVIHSGLMSLLRQGKVVIILDALDQWQRGGNKTESDLREFVMELARSTSEGGQKAEEGFAACPVIVTTRALAAGWLGLGEHDSVDLVEFDKKVALKYVGVACEGEAKGRIERLLGGSATKEMLLRPKLLSLACWLASKNELPAGDDFSPGVFYHQILNSAFQGVQLHSRQDGCDVWKLLASAFLAAWRDSRGTGQLTKDYLSELLKDSGVHAGDLPEIYQCLDETKVVERFSVAGVTYVQPAHRSFWEFLAGYGLAQECKRNNWQDPVREEITRLAWDPQWEEVMVFAFDCLGNVIPTITGREKERRDILNRMVHSLYRGDVEGVDGVDLLGYRAGLVYRCLVDVPPELFTDEMKQIVWEIREWRMAEFWFGRRHDDFEVLRATPLAVALRRIARVEEILDSSACLGKVMGDRGVSSAMLSVMGAWRADVGGACFNVLRSRAETPDSLDVVGIIRRNASTALGALGAAHEVLAVDCISILAPLAKTPNANIDHCWIRVNTATALGLMGAAQESLSSESLEILAPLAQTPHDQDGDGFTRCGVATALGVLGAAHESLASRCLGILARLAQIPYDQQGYSDVRHSATTALGDLGAAHESLAGDCWEILERLAQIPYDQDQRGGLRSQVATALGVLGAAHEGLAGNCWEILKSLAQTSHEQDQAGYTRKEAATALGVLGAAHESLAGDCWEIFRRLAQTSYDQDLYGDIRQKTATGLGVLGAAHEILAGTCLEIVEGLAQTAHHEDHFSNIRARAAISLGVLGAAQESLSPQCLGALERLAETPLDQDRYDWIRSRSATAFGAIGGSWPTVAEQAFGAVNPLLGDPSSDVRANAAESLVKIVRVCPKIASSCEVSLRTNAQEQWARAKPSGTDEERQLWWSAWGECYRHLYRMFRTGELGGDNPNEVSTRSGRHSGDDGEFKNLAGVTRDIRRAAMDFSTATDDVYDRSSCIWLIHRFWQPICTGPNSEAMRLFEGTPPGRGFYDHMRTIDELTAPQS